MPVVENGIAKDLPKTGIGINAGIKNWVGAIWMRVAMGGFEGEGNRIVRPRMHLEPGARDLPGAGESLPGQIRGGQRDGAGPLITRHTPGPLAKLCSHLRRASTPKASSLRGNLASKERRGFGQSHPTGFPPQGL